MADKNLKLGLSVNLQEGKKFQDFLQQLAQQGNKTAQALSKISVGGGGSTAFQKGALAKALAEDTKLMKELGATGQKLAQIFKQEVGRSTDEISVKIKKFSEQLKGVVHEHETASRRLAQLKTRLSSTTDTQEKARISAEIGGEETLVQTHAERAARIQTEYSKLLQQQEALNPPTPGVLNRVGGFLRNNAGRFAFIGGALALGAGAAAQELNEGSFDYLRQESATARLMGGQSIAIRRGDLSTSKAMVDLLSDPAKLKDAMNLMKRSDPRRYAEAMSGTLGQIFNNPLSLAGGIGHMARQLEAMPLKDKQMFMELTELQKGANTLPNEIRETIQGKSAGWVQAMRMMGGRGVMRGVFDTANQLGLSEDQGTQMFSMVMQQAGREGIKKIVDQALRAVAGGMSQGAAASMAAASKLSGQMGNNYNVLGDISYRVASNQIGLVQGEQIGQIAAQRLLSGEAITSGGGLTAVLSQGNPNTVQLQQKIQGLGVVSNIMGGGLDPYQNTLSWIGITKALGANQSPYALTAMHRALQDPATIIDINRGELPPELEAFGITTEQAQQAIKNINQTSTNRLITNGLRGVAGEMAYSLKNKYGGDLSKFVMGDLQGLDTVLKPEAKENRLRMAGALASQMYGISFSQGTGLIRDLVGASDKYQEGTLTDFAAGSTEYKLHKQLLEGTEKFYRDQLPGYRKGEGYTSEEADMRALAEQSANAARIMASFAGNLSLSGEDLVDAIKKIVREFKGIKFANQVGGGTGGGAGTKTGNKTGQ